MTQCNAERQPRDVGRFYLVDIVGPYEIKQVEQAATVADAYVHGLTEAMVATSWREFMAIIQRIRSLPSGTMA